MIDNDLTEAEKATIQTAIREKLDILISGCESLDMELAFAPFLPSPEFLMMATNGSTWSFDQYVTNNIEYLKECTSFRLTTRDIQTLVLDRSSAIAAWSYSVEATLHSGERDIIPGAGATFVFRLVNGDWKVIYYHESSVTPERLPAE